jgi:hypothetical protein
MDQNPAPDDQPDKQSGFQPASVVTSESITTPNQVSSVLPQSSVVDAAPIEQQNNFVESAASSPPNQSSDGVTWTASEFIAHHKSFGWYTLLGLAALVVAAVVWLVAKDIFSAALVFVGVLLLGVYGAHKPRQLTYNFDDQGITIGHMHHTFSEFRSFSVVSEGAFASIELVPLRRFAMYTTIYFDPADEDKIINVLSTHLPMEKPRNDLVEQLMRRVRF